MSNFQFNCPECHFISRLCSHQVEKLNELRLWALDAYRTLDSGTELMPLDQLGQWTGVRAVIESYPDEVPAKLGSDLKCPCGEAWSDHVQGSACGPAPQSKQDRTPPCLCDAFTSYPECKATKHDNQDAAK